MKTHIHRIVFFLMATLLGSMSSMLKGEITVSVLNNHQITCACYPSNYSITYSAVGFDPGLHGSLDRYDFQFEELSGDLA